MRRADLLLRQRDRLMREREGVFVLALAGQLGDLLMHVHPFGPRLLGQSAHADSEGQARGRREVGGFHIPQISDTVSGCQLAAACDLGCRVAIRPCNQRLQRRSRCSGAP